jgi:8-oxo-dGTP diphosphatase
MNYTYKYPRYDITCDIACVVWNFYSKQATELLLIKRGVEPDKGKWALPGGHLDPDELLIECAARELQEETGLVADLQPVRNFDTIDRSPNDRCICCLFMAKFDISRPEVVAGDDAVDYKWIKAGDLDDIDFAFDCKEMAKTILL